MKSRRFFFLALTIALMAPGAIIGQDNHSRQMKPVYTKTARAHDSIQALKIPMLEIPAKYHDRQLPSVVDNSKNIFWPGILDQYLFYTCQQYSGVAYVFGYEINRLRNQPGWYWENGYPTHYTWNFMNQGDRFTGVNFLQSFEIIKQQGHVTSNDYGMDTATSMLGWISGYDKYYRGMFNHLKQVSAIQVNSTAGINSLRNYLYDHLDGSTTGGIACYTTSSGTLYNMQLLPDGTPEEGKNVILAWQSDPIHAMTVVGYNDSIRFDVNNDGKYTNDLDITGDGIIDARDREKGGFKIANSYGNWWADTGYVYALYRSFALDYDDGGIWNNRVYVVKADTAYQPLLTVKVNLNYNARNKIRVLAGASSDTLDQFPEHLIDFPIFNFQGGEHAMQGNDTIAEAKSIEFGLDVTPLLNFVHSGQPARFFLMVEERDPDHIGQGKIEHVSFIKYQDGAMEIPVNAEDVAIKDNDLTLVSAVAAFEKPIVQITTTNLPAFSTAQPTLVQLEATGGRPPYDWSFVEEYANKPSVTPSPLISGTSLYVYSETKSFAPVALPFSFPFFGKRFDSIYINYFGFIAFGPQNLPAPYITDEMSMLRMFQLIVPSFSQNYTYQAYKNDGIWFQADSTHAIIRWKVSVSGHIAGSTDDFAVILYPDGRFEFCYGTMNNQGFVHTFYKGISKGDELNFDFCTQRDANGISGKSFIYYPPAVPENLMLGQTGLLSVNQADSSIIYNLNIKVADAQKISDSKVLMLSSGLTIAHELICGTDARLKSGQQASLKLILTNNGKQPIHDLALKICHEDSLLQVTDSLSIVPLLNVGQSLTIPSAFSFKMRHALPNNFPVIMTLHAESLTKSWKKNLLFSVAAPDIFIEAPCVIDGYNERLDPGEVADLLVNVTNTGALMAHGFQLQLVSPSQDITILSDPLIAIDHLEMLSSVNFHFQIQASRHALPGSDIPMQILLNDTSGVIQVIDFNLQVGTKPVALVNLSASRASANAMINALDSLHVGYDTINSLPFEYNHYASVFLILGTASSGSHVLTVSEGASLAAYLQLGGNLYMESYFTWYYLNKTALHSKFKYTSQKIPAYFFPEVKGVQGTFADSMFYLYSPPMNSAVFSFEPIAPAYPTLVNTGNTPKNLEIVYDGSDYKTIGTMLGFSGLNGAFPPSGQTVLMKRYLEFFGLDITGPYPLFHTGNTSVCQSRTVTFTDDSFDNIITRSWEFKGGTPASSNDVNPTVRYDATGKFDVKLTVYDGIRSKTILKQKYIQVENCSGAEERFTGPALFRLFPNPATNQVTIAFDRNVSGICTLQLYDLAGSKLKEVHQPVTAGNQVNFNLDGLAKGLYFLKVRTGELNSTLKVIKN